MKYVQGPMTTEIIAPTQTTDSLCPFRSHPGLEWLMSGTDGKMSDPVSSSRAGGERQRLMGDIRMTIPPV